jgi:bifunctional UDP-N-acetylglucosamine pyrophosphorylase/glucosamine-1-phosphate N-acetyltransferase
MKQILSSSKKEESSVVLVTTHLDEPYGYGRIVENQQGIFQKIVEEKDGSVEERKIQKVNAGIYCFPSQILCDFIGLVTNQNAQHEYYLTDVVEIIRKKVDNLTIITWDVPKEEQYQIMGVNTPEQLLLLEEYYLQKNTI